MQSKNFDKVFYFIYSPPLAMSQHQGALGIDFSQITENFDIVEIKQTAMDSKIVVTLFAKAKQA